MSGTRKSIGAITILMAVFGGVVLLGTGAAAAATGLRQTGSQGGTVQADVQGVTALDVDVRAAEVRVEFSSDDDEARLRIEGGSADGWKLRRDGDELQLRGPDRGFDWWQPDWLRGEERAVLVLPDELSGLDADLTLKAGSLDADGVFGELDVDIDAGSLSLNGDAENLDVHLDAGRADIDLDGVRTAEFTVNAGRIVSSLAVQPRTVAIGVSAGALDLTLPDADYDLQQRVSAGSLDSNLRQNDAGRSQIRATVSAGSVTLRASDG
ncbi:hypothetical protein ACFWHT_00320 [Microbacterium sp. NPDC058342]|uniref:hypothetical protein n=1 Tax=Microbacterium sp. NPDC058342 TaxID=3346454 RepID=UPI0036541326